MQHTLLQNILLSLVTIFNGCACALNLQWKSAVEMKCQVDPHGQPLSQITSCLVYKFFVSSTGTCNRFQPAEVKNWIWTKFWWEVKVAHMQTAAGIWVFTSSVIKVWVWAAPYTFESWLGGIKMAHWHLDFLDLADNTLVNPCSLAPGAAYFGVSNLSGGMGG